MQTIDFIGGLNTWFEIKYNAVFVTIFIGPHQYL